MSWIILEGIDRSGKSTVAEHFRSKGFTVVHLNAPDKKYSQPGYVGPTYLDEMLAMYAKYDDCDVVFDRSPYGEKVWPFVYGRNPMLVDEDFEVLAEYEERNDTTKYVLRDPDVEAHWQRCVDNKEPLNRQQFNLAAHFYKQLINSGFTVSQMSDWVSKTEAKVEEPKVEAFSPEVIKVPSASIKTPQQLKLENANAINDILAKRIIRQKGDMYDALEGDIRKFLNQKLGQLFGASAEGFSGDEVQILKAMAQRIKEKGGK